MPKIMYPSQSAYAATPQTSSHIGRYVHRTIDPSSDDQYMVITPKHENRPDLLAFELYGNPNYWWVFCSRNLDSIRDPIWDFVAGLEIVVPSNKHLKETLG
jgi:hypothetical protein